MLRTHIKPCISAETPENGVRMRVYGAPSQSKSGPGLQREPPRAVTPGGTPMQDEDTPSIIEQDASTDSAVLGLLMLETSHRPWAVDELAREMGSNVTDSLNRLYGGGLIQRLEGFVWTSHAAVYAEEMAQ